MTNLNREPIGPFAAPERGWDGQEPSYPSAEEIKLAGFLHAEAHERAGSDPEQCEELDCPYTVETSAAEQDAIARNTPEALIDRLGVAMTDLTAAIQHNTNSNISLLGYLEVIGETLGRIEQRLATSGEARSSVQVEQGAKEVRLTVKAYAGSPVGSVGDEAVSEFGRLFREIEQLQVNGWRETVAQQAERT